jgi:hypothetical protein
VPNFDPTPEEEAAAYAALHALIDEALRDLHSRVDFLHESWRGKTDE